MTNTTKTTHARNENKLADMLNIGELDAVVGGASVPSAPTLYNSDPGGRGCGTRHSGPHLP